MMAAATAKITQVSQNSLGSSRIALQAQQYAEAETKILQALKYKDLENAVHDREEIPNSNGYESEVELSAETDYDDDIKQRIATVHIYRSNENLPRYSLKSSLLSVKANSGVPVGTVIAWPSSKNPDDGEWLECNGQSCSSYPELVAVLGKSTVPDYRGVFLRGYGSHTSSHYGTVTHQSDALGVLQGDSIRNLTGSFGIDDRQEHDGSIRGAFYLASGANTGSEGRGSGYKVNFDASRVAPTSNENRPVNIAVRYLIKAA